MQNFDFNEALKAIQSGKPITGSDGVLAPLIATLSKVPVAIAVTATAKIPSNQPLVALSLKRHVTVMGNLNLSEEIAKHRFARVQDEGYA